MPIAAEPRGNAPNGLGRTYLLDGLPDGKSEMTVTVEGRSAKLEILNHPITGPVLSGPRLAPYECRTVENGMGPPVDTLCSARSRTDWYYRSIHGGFRRLPLPGSALPRDVTTTVRSDGVHVPFVVRVESGTINRGVFRIAMLAEPVAEPGKAIEHWNGRLVVWFGCCGSAQYNQGLALIEPGGDGIATFVLRERELSQGFAVAISSELINHQHANPHLQGETLMMLKEHFVERHGLPVWSLGFGYSGGAIQQFMIGQLFPGLLDGILAGLAFPETFMSSIVDCRLLQRAFDTDPGRWTGRKRAAVEGFLPGVCGVWDATFASALVVADDRLRGSAFGCGLRDPSAAYHPRSNPRGARCGIIDTNANVLGREPTTGFARRPFDNVGVQYGLHALRSGIINLDDFVTLNEQIGGLDVDGNPQPSRMTADPQALESAYTGGLVNGFAGDLGSIPIVTYRNNAGAPNDIHDRQQDIVIRTRLDQVHGGHDNHVALTAGAMTGLDLEPIGFDMVTRWMDAIAKEHGSARSDRVARHRPPDAVDTCWLPDRRRVAEKLSLDSRAECNVAYPLAQTPRQIAGLPLRSDVLKCALRPLRESDYPGGLDALMRERIKRVYPSGVCDESRGGVGVRPARSGYVGLPIGTRGILSPSAPINR
jgi:hypothetical protein